MTIFLKSCAYGTAAGAVLGLATLAWSENPSGKINNVARGASLGLYAGIGFGLYTINAQNKRMNQDFSHFQFTDKSDLEAQKNLIWFSPVTANSQIEGAQLNWATFSF